MCEWNVWSQVVLQGAVTVPIVGCYASIRKKLFFCFQYKMRTLFSPSTSFKVLPPVLM